MHRSVPLLLALAIAAGVFATPATAQIMPGMNGGPHSKMFTFGIGAGAAVPVNDAKDALKNGYSGLAYARVKLPGVPISFGANVSFQRFDLKTAQVTTTGGLPGVPTANTSVLAGLGEVRIDLTHARLHPYITAGLGAYNVKTDSEVAGSTNAPSQTRFGINGGAGLAMRLGPLNAYVQGRVDNVYTSNGGVIDTKSIQVVPVTVGVEF